MSLTGERREARLTSPGRRRCAGRALPGSRSTTPGRAATALPDAARRRRRRRRPGRQRGPQPAARARRERSARSRTSDRSWRRGPILCGRVTPRRRGPPPGPDQPAARELRSSQAFASLPVAHDGLGGHMQASAVSSTLKPPKNRISITRLLRSSTFASASSASSSATRSRPGSCREHEVGSQADLHRAAAALLVLLRAREIDEDAAHQASRHRQKVRAALPVHPLGSRSAAGRPRSRARSPGACGRPSLQPCMRAQSDAARRGRSE